MNAQEIFDKVLAHLRAQGKQSTAGGVCAYRSPEGNMCAVGCLIPDELYDPIIEDVGVGWLDNKEAPGGRVLDSIIDTLGISEHVGLLRNLQRAHDFPLENSLGLWEMCMETIAKDFGLHYTPPPNSFINFKGTS